jgi:hypothetical protein
MGAPLFFLIELFSHTWLIPHSIAAVETDLYLIPATKTGHGEPGIA